MKNLALALGAVLASFVLFELGLRLTGAYAELAEQELQPSPAIWERPRNAVERHVHPDLKVAIPVVYDDDGVRNHDDEATSAKKNIVGFFGDSFTENRRVEARFGVVGLLDDLAGGRYRMVNFGVDAYGLDQSYLRYLKYRDLDIRTVVYVLCENDLRNLYETGLTQLADDGTVTFASPRANRWLRLLGRLRTPYVAVAAYHQARALLRATASDADAFADRLGRVADRFSPDRKAQKRRLRDDYAESVVADLTSARPTPETQALAAKFRAVLALWKRTVEADGRRFVIEVLPRPDDRAVGTALVGRDPGSVLYLSDAMGDYAPHRFKNDVHWNEYGNLAAARAIAASPLFTPYLQSEGADALFAARRRDIDAYYAANGAPAQK